MKRLDIELSFCEVYGGVVGRQGPMPPAIGEALLFSVKGKLSISRTRTLTAGEHSKALTDLPNNALYERDGELTLRSTRRTPH